MMPEPGGGMGPGPVPGGNLITQVLGSAVSAFLTTLVVVAAINGGLALPGIGGLVSFAVGAAGFGAVLKQYLG